MTLYFCVDDANGMMFRGRRQSSDREVSADILRDAAGCLVIAPYSERLFAGLGGNYTVVSDLNGVDAPDAAVFTELPPTGRRLLDFDRVVIYRWNRLYPADVFFHEKLSTSGLRVVGSTDFTGKSHERITKEVYVR